MKLLKALFRFYINSSLHVALAVISLVAVTTIEFDVSLSSNFLFFIFFGTITGYNFVKYAPVAGLHHRSLASSLRLIQVFSFACFAALLYFTWQMPARIWYYSAGLGLLTMLYAIPLLKHRNLRTVPGLKIFIVAVVWSGVTVILPSIEESHSLSFDVWITAVQRLLLVLVLTLPFEIRDLNFDNPALGTIPQKIGVKKTQILGTLLVLIAMFLELCKTESILDYSLSLMAVSILTLLALWFSRRNQPDFYASFWVEGIPILWIYTLLILRHFFV